MSVISTRVFMQLAGIYPDHVDISFAEICWWYYFGLILPRFMGKSLLGIVAMFKPEGTRKRARLVAEILGSIDTPSFRLSIIGQDGQ
jgi:hypothetical protein